MGESRVSRGVFHHSQPHQIAQDTKISKAPYRRYAGSKTFAVSYHEGRASGPGNIRVGPVVLTSLIQFYTGAAHCGWVSRNEIDLVDALLTNIRRTLPVFMPLTLRRSIVLKNRHIILDFLRTMSDQNDLALQETGILAWGQIARYVGKSTALPRS